MLTERVHASKVVVLEGALGTRVDGSAAQPGPGRTSDALYGQRPRQNPWQAMEPPPPDAVVRLWGSRSPVGAQNSATLRDLDVFVDGSPESVTSDDRDVGGFGLGQCSEWGGLAKGSVWSVGVEVVFVLGEDSA